MIATVNKTITVELSEREAEILCALAGGVSWNGSEAAKVSMEFWSLLDQHLTNRGDSFSDLFEINADGDLAAR